MKVDNLLKDIENCWQDGQLYLRSISLRRQTKDHNARKVSHMSVRWNNLQTLEENIIEHSRIQNSKWQWPSDNQHEEVHGKFSQKLPFPHFFLPFTGDTETGGSCWTIFELKHYTRSTVDQHAIDVSPVSQEPGNPTPTILSRKWAAKKHQRNIDKMQVSR